jgi:lipoyl(octanoyl) transferase
VSRTLEGIWLGRRRYAPVLALQERMFEARRDNAIGDSVLFVEHEPVVTFGRGGKDEHVLGSEAELARAGIELARTGRGGDVTLHAPGQLVAYPILDLSPERRDVRRYVRDLAETMRLVLADHGVGAGLVERYVGLWVDAASPAAWPGESGASSLCKIGAIGVRISRWITMHGFALNLAPDLGLYRHIVPCGIREHGVTSVAALTGAAPSVRAAAERAYTALASILGAEMRGMRSELLDGSEDEPSGAPPSEAAGPAIRAETVL